MNHDDDGVSNTSNNRPFSEVLKKPSTRRKLLAGGLTAAAAGFLYTKFGKATQVSDQAIPDASMLAKDCPPEPSATPAPTLMHFDPLSLSDALKTEPAIAADYEYDVLIPWGTPLQFDVMPYMGDPDVRPSPQDQARMIGIGHDGMRFFPIDPEGFSSSKRGILCINHEYGTNHHLLGKSVPENLDDVRLSQYAHGMSVVHIAEYNRHWQLVEHQANRRIHVNTPVNFSGPASGHRLLRTPNGNIALGTLNNCSSGYTPWNTYLTCEENINGYFGANAPHWKPSPEQLRYGFSENGFGHEWHRFDKRFDLSDPDYKNEENRFGWIVELDPFDPTQTPVKRTALGRFKHEGAALTVGKGDRAVVYMGDDQRFDYIYKFVSASSWQAMRMKGVSPLDEGTLYVAKFNDGGQGEWLALNRENPALAKRFSDQAELVTFARIAADIVGATPMDRPEWISVGPKGDVYCTLTNNSERTEPNIANPMAPNPDGHILRWKDTEQHTGLQFTWDIFLVAKDSHGTESTYGSPDGLWADPDGRLFIETDGTQQEGLNNQLLVASTYTGEIRRLLTGVQGCEITGITSTPDRRTLFCNIQHPGGGDPKKTNFPAAKDGKTIPRDCTLVIRRKDGGVVGS